MSPAAPGTAAAAAATAAAAAGTADALEALVHQFSDPLSFYRELIQNAIDAGSAEVDVSIEFVPPAAGAAHGTLVVRVDDYGEGMNREIIDGKLTRLFSSSKDGDLTKIGRFGIGFVSVFAIEPEAVCIDTARDGESWRVLFERDRTFTRIARDEPVDGTKIRIVKRASADEHADFARRSREAIVRWCKHASAEVRFQGEPVNQPLDIPAACKVRHVEEGTEVVVATPDDGEPRLGFYNRGLTLLEGPNTIFPRVSMKVSSRWLEHTLTRDDVRREEGFYKAMAIVERLAGDALPRRIFEMLEVALARGEAGAEAAERLYRAAARHVGPAWLRTWRACDLSHGYGHADGDAWVADPARKYERRAGHWIYGPHAQDVPADTYAACWRLAAEPERPAAVGPNAEVATLDVYDATRPKMLLPSRKLLARELTDPGRPQLVQLYFLWDGGGAGGKLELRIAWQGRIALRAFSVGLLSCAAPGLGAAAARIPEAAARAVFRTPDGRPVTLAAAHRALDTGRLLAADVASPLSAALEKAGHLVVRAPAGGGAAALLEALAVAPPPRAERRFGLPVPAAAGEFEALRPLGDALEALLRAQGAKLRGVAFARFDYPGSGIGERVAISQAREGELTPLAEAVRLGRGLLSRRRVVVVNAGHPAVRRLATVARREPELAAYLLAKLFFLHGELDPALDAALCGLAWAAREGRRAGRR